MSKLNVLISAYACNPRATLESHPGEAILGWNLIKQISRFHNTRIITQQSNKEDIEAELKRSNIDDLNFIYVGMAKIFSILLFNYFGIRIYYWIWQIKSYFTARALKKKFDFDLFHQITFSNDWMPSYIGAYSGLPFIWGPVGGGQKVPRKLRRELPARVRINEWARSVFQWFWRQTPSRERCARKAKAILVCNNDTRNKFSKKTESIYDFPVNGIYLQDYPSRAIKKQESGKFNILFAGRLVAIKGILMGIRAFHLFSQKNTESLMTIVGDGPDEERIKDLIRELGLEEKIELIPWLSQNELFELMGKSDVFLFPSLRDGGGAVLVEAMASECPVIGLDIGGPGVYIQDEFGFKILPVDSESVIHGIADALEKLYLNIDLREKMGKAALRRVEEQFQWDHLGEKLQNIYSDVIQG